MAQPPVERARLTFRRLSGLDRSGPPPPQTLAGQPLNPWTIPNAIGYIRLALIPVFLILAFNSEDGTDALPVIIFALIGWSDYLDGIAARVTGQYSRLGTLLDPLVDRLLVLSGVIVCWHFELLPRWGLALLAAREVFVMALVRFGMHRGIDLKVNWLGRAGVWPIMSALFFAMCGVEWLADACLYIGLALVLGSAAQYVRDGIRRWGRAADDVETRFAKPRRQLEDRYACHAPTPGEDRDFMMDTFPDLGSLSDQELKDLIQQLTDEEQEVSYRRRILHGKIDILRAELVNRLRKKHEGGEDVISGADVQRLTDILAGRASGGDES